MGLISTKHILTPFTNKLHLTTIILFVSAFAILRASGGSVSVEKESLLKEKEITIDDLVNFPERQKNLKIEKRETSYPWASKKNEKKINDKVEEKEASLDDIESLLR